MLAPSLRLEAEELYAPRHLRSYLTYQDRALSPDYEVVGLREARLR